MGLTLPKAESTQFSALLKRMKQGDRDAADHVISLVYEELHRIAALRMNREQPGHVLQATALIHEAWIRLMGSDAPDISSRQHFLAAASRQMRNVLVDHARRERTQKRGGDGIFVSIDDLQIPEKAPAIDVLALDEVLTDFQRLDPRAAQIVEYRYFGGRTEQEVAEILGISRTTVHNDTERACAWLHMRIGRASDSGSAVAPSKTLR